MLIAQHALRTIKSMLSMCLKALKVVTNEKGEAVGEVLTIIC
jgi:hypothetical protein